MKKSIAYLLLICFVLYNFGYYVVYFSFNSRIEKSWAEKIYGQEEILDQKTLKIPISLHYVNDDQDFKEINSVFEKEGEYFRIIKQKYAKDTLTVVYVSDNQKNNLENTIKKWAASMAQEGQSKSGKIDLNNFVKDYMQPYFDLNLKYLAVIRRNLLHNDFTVLFENETTSPNSPPPETI